MTQCFKAEVVLIHPDFPLAPTLRDVSDVNIREGTRPLTPPESPILFYIVTGPDFQDLESALANDHTVNDWDVRMDFTDCRIYRTHIDSVSKFVTPKIANLGIHVLSKYNSNQGWHFEMLAPNKEVLGKFWEYCRKEGVEFHLEKLHRSQQQPTAADSESFKAQLTDRQREVVRTVMRMGYYDQNGASTEEVAAELGIASSTLSTHLHRTIEKLFRYMFEKG